MCLASSHTPENSRISKIARWKMPWLFRSLEARVSRITGFWNNLWLRHCPTDTRIQFYVIKRMLRQSIYCCSGDSREPVLCFLHAIRKLLCLDYASGLAKWCHGSHFGLRISISSHYLVNVICCLFFS